MPKKGNKIHEMLHKHMVKDGFLIIEKKTTNTKL